jgi:HTH-type transcriptional regulator/antitoxin HigA
VTGREGKKSRISLEELGIMASAVFERPHVLHSPKEYDVAVLAVHQLLERDPKKGTREFELLELLTLLVEDYETRNIPEPPTPTPQAMVEFMLEQKGLTRAALVQPLGGRSRVSEFFAGKRALSTGQLRALRSLLGIPADLLLEDEEETTRVQVATMRYKPSKPEPERLFFSKPDSKAMKALVGKRNPARKK